MHYRLRQLVRALNGRIFPHEQSLVTQLLSTQELALFVSMARFDQRHCLDVCLTLLRAGYSTPALLRAALLHDVGKVDDAGQPIPLLYYGIFVLLKKVAPNLYRHAASNGRGLLRPFATHANHEQRTIKMAMRAGCSRETLAILRDYAHGDETAATQALGWADNVN